MYSVSQKKNNTLHLVVTPATADRFSKFIHWQILTEIIYACPPHLNCSTTLPCEIWQFKITVKLLLLLSKLISFTRNFTKQKCINIHKTQTIKISASWMTAQATSQSVTISICWHYGRSFNLCCIVFQTL